MNLTTKQKNALLCAAKNDSNPCGWAPCGKGFARTMKSLINAGLACSTSTSIDGVPRGIRLTAEGKKAL